MRAKVVQLLVLSALFASSATAGAAQQGAILARATEAATARPLPSVVVTVTGANVSGLTNQSGQLRLAVAPGSYTVTFSSLGYETRTVTGVAVTAGQTTEVGATLQSAAISLDEIVISAGRRLEKKTETVVPVYTISERTIEERPVTTAVQHLQGVTGVDMIQQGAQSANVVVRGFNNIFSGALHALTDNRIAGVPSLRVNLLHFIPSNDDDLARMEVVLGPGSALYGPNTANGVLHFITKSPLTNQGTTVAVGGGERDFFKAMFRTSHLVNDEETFGIKVSGQYLRGVDWRFTDPAEVEARARGDFVAAGLAAQGASEAEIALALQRLGIRDYQIQRWGGEIRADWRVTDEATLIFQTGATSADGIELTGIGAGQTDDWLYSYYQTRLSWNRFFAQAYLNASDAGDSYLVRQGVPLVDNSKMYVGQLQHGVGFGETEGGQVRQDFTYGVDVFLTRPRTEGRINGKYEDEDNIDEVGAYLQSETAVTDKLDFVAALRVDDSSVLDDLFWSPRLALLFKPAEQQSFRATFNRAFSTPTTLNYFLDINGGLAQGLEQLGFFQRAMGPGHEGISFTASGGGIHGIRSPFTPAALGGPGQIIPADPNTLWQFGVGILQAQGAIDQQTAAFLAGIDMTGVPLNLLDPIDRSVTPLAQATVNDVPKLRESTTETYEVGYTGVLDNRFALSGDIWYSKRKNFTSPLVVATDLVLLDAATLVGRLIAAGMDPATAQALAAGTEGQPGVGRIPLGVVTSPDVVTSTADIVATYRNFGEVDLWGWDLALKAFLTSEWTLDGSLSWVNSDHFLVRGDEEIEDFDEITDVNEVLGLNAPDFKGSVALGYRNDALTVEGRGRFISEFPVNSADFIGLACLPLSEEIRNSVSAPIRDCVESTALFDLLLGYRVSDSAELQLNVQNVFDEGYASFVGVPEIGRFALLQLKYNFGS